MKPLVELHCHFDGSLDFETSYQLAKERGIVDEQMSFEEFKQRMIVPKDNKDLGTFLDRFVFPIAILQDEEAIYRSMCALIQNLANEGLIYAEIRYAPQVHCQKGMSQAEVVAVTLKAKEWAKTACPSIQVNFILCMMVYAEPTNTKENQETIHVAKQFLGKGVVAIDLAGYEGGQPMLSFQPLFEEANELGVPYTIHAGESGPAKHVEEAIMMGAKRIGHGGHCTQDEQVVELVIQNKIPLEICPTSNVQCHNQPSYELHALHELHRKGALVTISTDNRSLSDVSLVDEYDFLIKTNLLTEADLHQFTLNAIHAAFISDEEKEALIKKL